MSVNANKGAVKQMCGNSIGRRRPRRLQHSRESEARVWCIGRPVERHACELRLSNCTKRPFVQIIIAILPNSESGFSWSCDNNNKFRPTKNRSLVTPDFSCKQEEFSKIYFVWSRTHQRTNLIGFRSELLIDIWYNLFIGRVQQQQHQYAT